MTKGIFLVFVGISIVVIGGYIMVYVTPSTPFTQETGFISSADAKKNAPIPGSDKIVSTTFVMIKYHNPVDSRINATIVDVDPYNTENMSKWRYQIIINCYPCQWEGKSNRFVWNFVTLANGVVSSNYLIDAKTGKFIGEWTFCSSCV